LSSATGAGPAGRAGAVRSRRLAITRRSWLSSESCRPGAEVGTRCEPEGHPCRRILDLRGNPAREERGSSGRDGCPARRRHCLAWPPPSGVQGASSCGRWSRWAIVLAVSPVVVVAAVAAGDAVHDHTDDRAPPPAGLRARVARGCARIPPPAGRAGRVARDGEDLGIGHHAHRRRVDQDAIVQGPESLQDTGKRHGCLSSSDGWTCRGAFQDIQPGTRGRMTSARGLVTSRTSDQAYCHFRPA